MKVYNKMRFGRKVVRENRARQERPEKNFPKMHAEMSQ